MELNNTADWIAELLEVDPEKIMTEPKDNVVALSNSQARRLARMADKFKRLVHVSEMYVPQMLVNTNGKDNFAWLDIAGPFGYEHLAQGYIDDRPDNYGDNMRVVKRTTTITDEIVNQPAEEARA